MSDNTYNGWSNKPTWLVNVWFNPETKADLDMIESLFQDGEYGNAAKGVNSDLMSWAVSHINWHELRESMDIEEEE